jgi:hypothetical protein
MMSTLTVAEGVVERGSTPTAVVEQPRPVAVIAKKKTDEHGLVPVFIFGIIAFALSTLMIGSILIMLSLRHSGVMAP